MKVLVTGNLPDRVIPMLSTEHEVAVHELDSPMERSDLLARVSDKQGVLCMITDRIDEELLERAPELTMIANCAVGYDNIDVEAATRRGILVSNTPGVLTDATADLTFALILAVARRVVEGDKRTRAGEFKFWAPFLFLGREVSGKTLGIIGLGSIGRAVAKRASGFNMKVLYHNRRRVDASVECELNAEYAELESLLSQSDFVSIHVPLTPKTHHLIARKELELMKSDAFLINVARGPVVDEKALAEALQNGDIAGAGLDVYENEPIVTPALLSLDNVTLLPHVGSATKETRAGMATLAVENLMAGLRGDIPPTCLNYEQASRNRGSYS